ncbi:MAG: hypothetical protein ABGX26_02905 [Nautiliaceae bacterium]
MPITRGVVSSWKAIGARPVRVSATEPIAIVLVSNEVDENKTFYFDSFSKALNGFLDGRSVDDVKTGIENGSIKGNLFKYLVWANNKYDLVVPTIISIAKYDDDADVLKTNIINAIAELKNVPGDYSIRPDIISVPDYTTDLDIANQYFATINILKARGFIDLDAVDGSDAIEKRGHFGSERLTPIYTNLIDWNTLTDSEDEYSANFVLSVFRCVVDGSDLTTSVGWSYSLSNKTLPVKQAKNKAQFIMGLPDETDLLTNNQITSFIAYNGIRVWNYQTTSPDALLQDARRVRIFDKLSMAVLDAIFPFIDSDRGVYAVKEAKDTIRAFNADMIGKRVLIGAEIYLDEDLTTPTAITEGKFYFKVEAQENPSPTLISVEFDRVDKFSPIVYKIINS